jgi:glycolate oxidase
VALNREFYGALEDVLGAHYISDDPIIIESYPMPVRKATYNKDVYLPRFEAVVLPGNTEEVAAVVKLCNKYKVQYKASSTGWLYCDPTKPNCIKIDLRRMNRIIEINEKSMYAVVEPYVIGAQLHAECMKRGLTNNTTGAGANCSALPYAAHVNLGHLSQSGSYGERNILGVEWVTGDGEIVRMGSLGSGDEWFSGDGPGPSLRGIVRGNTTPLGGLGVFTKAAQKLYHWAGPADFDIQGVCPYYKPAAIPPNFLIRFLSFLNMDVLCEAVRMIGEAEIGYELMGFNAAMMASNIATNNDEDVKYYRKFLSEVKGPGFLLIVIGNSLRDFEYKKAVLEQIIKDTDAKSMEEVEDPEIGAGFLWRFIRIVGSIRETSRATGVAGGTVGGTDLFPLMAKFISATTYLKEQLIKDDLILDESSHPFVMSIEHGHQGHGEILIRYTPKGPDSYEKVQGLLNREANKRAIEGHFGVPQHVWSDALHDMYGPHAMNYHSLLRKVKNSFDPNNASETSNYITVKKE